MKRLQEYIHKLYEFENRAEYDRWFERKLQTSETELSVISENELVDGSIVVEIRMTYPCMSGKSWHC